MLHNKFQIVLVLRNRFHGFSRNSSGRVRYLGPFCFCCLKGLFGFVLPLYRCGFSIQHFTKPLVYAGTMPPKKTMEKTYSRVMTLRPLKAGLDRG